MIKSRIVKVFYFTFLLFIFLANSDRKNFTPIIQTCDNLSYNQKSKNYILWGNVKIIWKDKILTCNKLIYNSELKKGEALGNPVISQPGAFLKSKSFKANLNKGRVDFFKAYLKIMHYKKDLKIEKALKENGPVELFADNLKAFYKKGVYKGIGNIKLIAKNKIIKSDRFIYYYKSNLLIFFSNVELKEKENNLKCDRITFDLNTNTFHAEGLVKGELFLK